MPHVPHVPVPVLIQLLSFQIIGRKKVERAMLVRHSTETLGPALSPKSEGFSVTWFPAK